MSQTLPAGLAGFLARDAVLVELTAVRGSAPREAGAFMLVAADALYGTIGGGQFEFIAIDHARQMLSGAAVSPVLDIPLGPEIGQCCGGRTELCFSRLDATLRARLLSEAAEAAAARPAVYLFGAGHVGQAIAQALAPLPFAVHVVETRTEAFEGLPEGVTCHLAALPEALVDAAPPGAALLILTHDHALDFLIATRALARPDLAYVGMIGSQTKKATFRSHLAREGLPDAAFDRLTLPIGGSTVRDKRPAVIAAMVAAELLAVHFGR